MGVPDDDAAALFGQCAELEPNWGGCWGLKPSATEVPTCSSRHVHVQQYAMLHRVSLEWMQAILRAHQSDAPGGNAKELEALSGLHSRRCVEFDGILACADFGLSVCFLTFNVS